MMQGFFETFDLFSGLAFLTNFKNKLIVDEKVGLFARIDFMNLFVALWRFSMMLTDNTKIINMETLKNEIENCAACELQKTRNKVIFGEGNYRAAIMIIGEAPGADEDRIGRPFVGQSGQLLDKILAACGFSRDKHVFISNIVKCRPPGNRMPAENEVAACIPFLLRQIEMVDPKIIIPLGATALKRLFGNSHLKISRLRGTWMEYDNKLVMPVYHPSALLRNPNLKRDTWEDFKKLVFKYRELVDANHYSAHV